MKIIERIEDIDKPFTNAVITIGNFDGVHIGHQSLFHEVILKAAALKGTSVAMTFDPHPLRVLTNHRHPPLITLNEQKKELIAATELDVLIVVPFTREFAAISAEDFITELLVKRIGMKAIIVGPDYSFGKNREGDIHLLRALGRQQGFERLPVLALFTAGLQYFHGVFSSLMERDVAHRQSKPVGLLPQPTFDHGEKQRAGATGRIKKFDDVHGRFRVAD